MTETALWRIPLEGYCDVCALPAEKLIVYPSTRVIIHKHGGACYVGNPPPNPFPLGQNVHRTVGRAA